jgi:hypothetical protein
MGCCISRNLHNSRNSRNSRVNNLWHDSSTINSDELFLLSSTSKRTNMYSYSKAKIRPSYIYVEPFFTMEEDEDKDNKVIYYETDSETESENIDPELRMYPEQVYYLKQCLRQMQKQKQKKQRILG